MKKTFLCFMVFVALISMVFAKTKHQKMFEDLYLYPEDELIKNDFIGLYALLVHRNILANFLIPSPEQEATWGSKPAFILNNPQLVNLALALGKNKIADQIITEVEKRRPRGFDLHPEYAGQHFPLPDPSSEAYPSEMVSFLPLKWIEHQFVGVTIIPSAERPAINYAGAPAMCICVLNQNDECFDTLIEHGYKPTITSNRTYVLEPVLLAATLNIASVIPKLVDIGSPFDMSERGHILTSSSPYLLACSHGNVEFVEQMLRMGYDIDEQHGSGGDTCLHSAAQGGHYALVHFLIEKGADITIVHPQDGQSAYSLSVQHHHRHVQALLAEAFLKQRLPLPKPPTMRQRTQDLERSEQINKYIQGYMQRTGLTQDDIINNMDATPYDPYYDFNGTYDPDQHLGNVDRAIPADHIGGSGVAHFLVELDGVMYTAGTHTYEEKKKEYLAREEEKIRQRDLNNSRQREELLAMVDEALALRTELDRVELEQQKRMPDAPGSTQNPDRPSPDAYIPDYDHNHLLSTKIVDDFAKKQKKEQEKLAQQQQPQQPQQQQQSDQTKQKDKNVHDEL